MLKKSLTFTDSVSHQDIYYFNADGDILNITIFISNTNFVGNNFYVYSSQDGNTWFPIFEKDVRVVLPVSTQKIITTTIPNGFPYLRFEIREDANIALQTEDVTVSVTLAATETSVTSSNESSNIGTNSETSLDASIDAFARKRFSQPYTVFDSKQISENPRFMMS